MKNLSKGRVSTVGAMLGAVLVFFAASTAGAQTVEEVIAKNVKAQGGRDALMGVKYLERKGTVAVDGSFGQMEGTVEDVSIPWKKARRALDLAVFQQKEGYNGTTAWREGMQGVQELEGEEANQIKQAVELNPFLTIAQQGTKAEKLEDAAVDEVDCYVVQLTPKERPAVKIFIDKKTDQIKRSTLTQTNPQFGKVDVVIETSGYEAFGPIKLPTKTKVQLGELLQIDTTFTETKVDGKVDDTLFEKPADAAK